MKKNNLSIILTVCSIVILSVALIYNVFGDKAVTLIKERKDKANGTSNEYVDRSNYDIKISNTSEFNIPEGCDLESVAERFYKDNFYDAGSYTLELEYFTEDVTFSNRYFFKFNNMDLYGDVYYIEKPYDIFKPDSIREYYIVNMWSKI